MQEKVIVTNISPPRICDAQRYRSPEQNSRQFFEWVEEGPSTYADRKAMFEARKAAVEDEMKQLEKTLDMLKFKCWYYEKAMEDGNEDGIHAMLPDNLPPEIQPIYDNSHDR